MQVFLEIVITLATLGFVFFPLAARKPTSAARAGDARATSDELAARRDTLLDEVRELEFDRDMGKITSDDYNRLQAGAASEIEAVQQRMVAVAPTRAARKPHSEPAPGEFDREIEAEVLVARARLAKKSSGGTG